MSIRHILFLCLLSVSLHGQIPDSVLNNGLRIIDSIHRYHKVPNLLQYNCRLSYTEMVLTRWPDCPENRKDTVPDLTDHHALDLYEKYRMIFDYAGHAKVSSFAFLHLNHKGNYVATNYFLSDHPIKQYQRINYSKSGAIDIARKIGLKEGIQEWRVELVCRDLRDYDRAAIPMEQLEFMWEVSNVLDPGDGCEISGQYLVISADTGQLVHDGVYAVTCED